MAAGLPVVAVRSGGVPEIVVEGRTGLLSDVGDAPSLAQNLSRLLCNPDLARCLGTEGRRRARELFDPRRVASLWTELLEDAAAGRFASGGVSVRS
jgi:glycosyltransferase involved in cell wall biosynthesis